MSFIVRAVNPDDLEPLYDLARQFALLNLPADRAVIERKIARSGESFAGRLGKADAEYMLVAEDTDSRKIVGSSLILAKNGTPTQPNFVFKILKKEHFSEVLGVAFIHQLLRLYANTDGPTEVGGLVVDRAYRRRPEKIGELISLSRFLYIGMRPERFETDLHSEMTLAEDGRSEFWEALGRRFTGLTYQEADQMSAQNNAFIPNLFPSEDIYLALLDTPARLVLGKVGSETRGALKLLERVGMKYKEEVDPFDGGPHLGCTVGECTLIQNMRRGRVAVGAVASDARRGLLGLERDAGFVGTATPYAWRGDELVVPEDARRALDLAAGEAAFVTPF